MAVLAGAGRGIGREIALHLARNGAFVIAHYGSNCATAEQPISSPDSRCITRERIRVSGGSHL